MARLRLLELETYLRELEQFDTPKVRLEQYSTPPHIGAHILYAAQTRFDDIENCLVADLGAGCGVLSFGARMLGASHVVGFEIDEDALRVLARNRESMELSVDAVQCDVTRCLPGKFEKCFDTVITNPPFGTKSNAGIDVKFLETATKLARRAVYSLHKSSTRSYILEAGKRLGTKPKVIAELIYDLPRAYSFHRKASVDVQVDLVRFAIS